MKIGMAKPVADTDNRGEAAAGFVSDDSLIQGFSQLHDSGKLYYHRPISHLNVSCHWLIPTRNGRSKYHCVSILYGQTYINML